MSIPLSLSLRRLPVRLLRRLGAALPSAAQPKAPVLGFGEAGSAVFTPRASVLRLAGTPSAPRREGGVRLG